MPFNFYTLTDYQFDFSILSDVLSNEPVFSNQLEYRENWINILKRLDKKIVRPNSQQVLEWENGPFTQDIYFDGQVYYLNFNIDAILESITQENVMPVSMSLDEFGLHDSPILFSPEPWNHHHLNSSKPIVACLFPAPLSERIVIDGNHRVSAKKTEKHTSILTILYDTLKPNHFYCELDWAFYLLRLEIYRFSILIKNGGDVNRILKKSKAYTVFKKVR